MCVCVCECVCVCMYIQEDIMLRRQKKNVIIIIVLIISTIIQLRRPKACVYSTTNTLLGSFFPNLDKSKFDSRHEMI